ncbi:MAG: DUF2249 domain-containing protein [Sterolibacterium sp.]|nr:DUF2249 domain-containing protein [Sterolibacterium sp.]
MVSVHQQVSQLDLRQITAVERQPRVFDRFNQMQPGDTLWLTHFHHSLPLLYLLLAESPRGFTWKYLEEGPKRWRIRIDKMNGVNGVNRKIAAELAVQTAH